jgi:thiol-disulfide isomerase/thioredoxin
MRPPSRKRTASTVLARRNADYAGSARGNDVILTYIRGGNLPIDSGRCPALEHSTMKSATSPLFSRRGPSCVVALLAAALSVGAVTAVANAQAAANAKPADDAKAEAEKVLVVGAPAPALKVTNWIKGGEVAKIESGTVYIVEFWATWCGPCRKTIPHLNEVAKSYKDKGVKVIGVSIWEETKSPAGESIDPLPGIKKFVDEMGDKMEYHVGFGGADAGGMADTWMRAANRQGIPSAFIVDKQGRIAWIGHPMEETMVKTLDSVIAGTFDPTKAAEEAKRAAELQAKSKELGNKLRGAVQGGRPEETLDVAREMFRLDPASFPNAAGVAFQQVIVNMKKPDLAYAFAKEMFAGPLKDSAQDLNTIAWTILDDSAVKERDIPLALAMATRAAELTKQEDGAMLDTLARAQWDSGERAKALETQRKAVEKAKGDQRIPPQIVKQLEQTLARYEAQAK